jgi:4-amino-4-deoxy-L-arabinose transferase-like glycosyltransferase
MRRAAAALAALLLLYLYGLTSTGMLGPDEPRYASIGREMARSGDWVTPRLWREPWFEKPALVYWMTAAGFRTGLGEDLAPRLPVALAGVAFLVFYWRTLRRHFGAAAAWYAGAVLGTSAGWLAYSYVAVMDLPLSAAFGAAMLISLDWVSTGDRRRLPLAAAMLGAAVLAKGLVPLVLAAPLLMVRPKNAMDWARPLTAGAFLTVAAPWYVLCWLRNGEPFIRTFFLEHQFGRFSSEALQHVQPAWFYVPVMAGTLLPWTPLIALLFRRSLYSDRRRLLLLLWAVFGLVFFSASTNKLPGYVLPLVPALAALIGIALAETKRAAAALSSCAVMLLAIPVAVQVLPDALAAGLSRAARPAFSWLWLVPLALSAVVWRMRSSGAALAVVAAATFAGVLYLKIAGFPAIESAVSARPLWHRIAPRVQNVCVERMGRSWRYGLNYYSGTPLPDCAAAPRPLAITQPEGGRPAPPSLAPYARPE